MNMEIKYGTKKLITDKEIIELYNNGRSLASIGREYGISPEAASKKLKAKGVKIFNKHNNRGTYHNIFKHIDTEEKAYWLGFLYADGSIHSTKTMISISLAKKDKCHLEKFKKFIGAYKNNLEYRSKQKAYRFTFSSKEMKKDLINLGCTPNKSLTLTFPTFLKKHLIRHFIRGYFEGDGALTYSKSKLNILTPRVSILGTDNILYNILKLNNLTHLKLHTKKNCAVKSIVLSKNQSIEFLNWIYKDCNIYLDRKFFRYFIFKENNFAVPKKKFLGLSEGNIGEGLTANTELTNIIA